MYTVTVTNAAGCPGTDDALVTVEDSSTPIVTPPSAATAAQTLCQ
jgi:hypothetical protein